MRHRTPWYREAAQELLCYFLGHRWKHSWRSRDDRADREARYDSLTYREKREGNPFCWYSAGWHVKCRRCRLRVRGDDWHPWYMTLWWTTKNAFSTWRIMFSCYHWNPKREAGHSYAVHPWYVALVMWTLGGFLIAAEQSGAWLSLAWHLPSFPFDWASALLHRLHLWAEKHERRFRWMPPDSGRADEVGFWLAEDYAKSEPRMRVYLTSGFAT